MIVKEKFNEEKKYELFEYAVLRLQKLAEKYERKNLIGEIVLNWDRDVLRDIKYHRIKIAKDKDEVWTLVPSSEFWVFIFEGVKTVADFEFIKWLMDELDKYLDNLYKKAEENEQKLQMALDNSDAYLEYKSLKITEKLNNTTLVMKKT